jgi:Family of unknown function (DUF5681)
VAPTDLPAVGRRVANLDALGYKRPVGQSKGRPKKPSLPVSTAYLFRKIANERVVVEAKSGNETMTRWEALARMVQNQALSKDPSAARLLHQMRKKFPGKAARVANILWSSVTTI